MYIKLVLQNPDSKPSSNLPDLQNKISPHSTKRILSLNAKTVCLVRLEQKRLELRPVAFRALIRISESLAANPASRFLYGIMASSPSAVPGSVAAGSARSQCSHRGAGKERGGGALGGADGELLPAVTRVEKEQG